MRHIQLIRKARQLLSQEVHRNLDQGREKELMDAVIERFNTIHSSLQPMPDDPYSGAQPVYDAYPVGEDFAWKFLSAYAFEESNPPALVPAVRHIKPEMTVESIRSGQWDQQIESVWHEAASNEGWYRNEKDWY